MFDYGEEVIWHQWTPGGLDEYGTTRPGTFQDHIIDRAGFAPESVTEPQDDQQSIVGARLFLTSPVRHGQRDQFTVRGLRFAVVGDGDSAPGQLPTTAWMNPFTGNTPGQEIRLKRVKG